MSQCSHLRAKPRDELSCRDSLKIHSVMHNCLEKLKVYFFSFSAYSKLTYTPFYSSVWSCDICDQKKMNCSQVCQFWAKVLFT